jgi:hypothetical protein
VYTAGPDNLAKIQPVTVAQTTGNLVGLSSGVSAGTNVVIDGQDKLQDGTQVNPTVAPMPTVVAAVNAPNAAAPRAASPSAVSSKTLSGATRR